jgi:hypothetical protein
MATPLEKLQEAAKYTKSSHAAPIGGDYRLNVILGKPIYIVSFLLLTLVIYWITGYKGTFLFLIVVLVGQLIGSASEISKGLF